MGPVHPDGAFVLRTRSPDGSARWVVAPPRDPYGDGYVLTVATELHDEGLSAVAVAQIDGVAADREVLRLPAFVRALADGWRGWDGVRSWRSLDRGLLLDARHDGRGYVELEVALGQPRRPTRWTARALFRLEAGEELARVATDLADALRA